MGHYSDLSGICYVDILTNVYYLIFCHMYGICACLTVMLWFFSGWWICWICCLWKQRSGIVRWHGRCWDRKKIEGINLASKWVFENFDLRLEKHEACLIFYLFLWLYLYLRTVIYIWSNIKLILSFVVIVLTARMQYQQ